MTITNTTLCICRHIRSMHNQETDCMLCRCSRFQVSSRKSSSHYQRGQATGRKRVARLVAGDRILVGFPGHDEYVRVNGRIVFEQFAGELTSHPQVRHVEDDQLRPVEAKTGALLATVTDAVRTTDGWAINTNLGSLPLLLGHQAVHVLTEPPS